MIDPAVEAWYDQHEADFVRRAIEMIRVWQYKMPRGIGPYYHYQAPWPQDWWSAFWEMLEREAVVEQRELFVRRWRERHQPGGRQAELDEKMIERHPYTLLGQTGVEAFADGGDGA